MEAANAVATEKSELKAKLENVVEKAKKFGDRLQGQTAAAAEATDKTIRKNPYQALGIALGVGVLVGVLVMWSRRASGPLAEHDLRPGPGD
jgi:ElaB/YqjD/DUF883 family membrane-anchored ribosome-binding protein